MTIISMIMLIFECYVCFVKTKTIVDHDDNDRHNNDGEETVI